MLITASNLNLTIAERPLLKNATFTIDDNQKVALVGPNGTGKSTLLSCITKQQDPLVVFSGALKAHVEYSFLPQNPVPEGLGIDEIALNHIISSRGLDLVERDLTEIQNEVAAHPSEENIQKLCDLQEKHEKLGGYTIETDVSFLADGIGLDQELLMEDVTKLSGGQRRRVDLIRLLYSQKPLLILDEPTNHLDKKGRNWLFEYLGNYKGGMLVVSHDIELLDSCLTKVIAIEPSALELIEIRGNYTHYKRVRADQIEFNNKLHSNQKKEIDRLSATARNMKGRTARLSRTAKAIESRVEKLETNKTTLIQTKKGAVFKLPDADRGNKVVVDVQNLGVAYDDNHVIKDLSFLLSREDRCVVIGKNGVGKSSLLRSVAGEQTPTAGNVEIGGLMDVGYFSQENEKLDFDKTPLEYITKELGIGHQQASSFLGAFGLSEERVKRKIKTLSGGEKAKVALAEVSCGKNNFLLLDEPTNNLDIDSMNALATMLKNWNGSFVIVSHESWFVKKIKPTKALLLPDEQFLEWDDSLLAHVSKR